MNTLAMSLLFACVGVMLAWLLRRPARRLAGAGPAFCVWALPPLLAVAAWLPAWHTAALHELAPVLVLPQLLIEPPLHAVSTGPAMDLVYVLFYLWLIGCGAMVTRLALHCLHIARRSQPLPDAIRTAIRPYTEHLDFRSIRLHPAGPAVCWLPGCRLLLPADLLQRFNDEQRAQVMAHECMHLARRDPAWSLIAELMLAALWFFPPAWIAMSRFRLDQELACDAAIVNRTPRHAARYARALLSGATTSRTLAATTPWLTQSQLKERLTMIQSHSRSPRKRGAGYAALITLLAGTALAAHAAMPAPSSTAHSAMQSPAEASSARVIMSYRLRHPPRYPAEAVKNHEEGIVVLKVLVDPSGKPVKTLVEAKATHASQALIDAAKAAVADWKFNPMKVDGKAVKGWARIPIKFKIPAKAQSSGNASTHVIMATRARHPSVYPPAAIKNHEEGTVVLKIHVSAQGEPTKVIVDKDATHASQTLITAAVKAAKQWRYNPGRVDGKAEAGWARVPVTFKIPEQDTTKQATTSASGKH
ncbi:MAG TPA: TonB family protein [Oleiagrimonas sp.]|nr:TonB family protein [Oleiagrimonas sp.]